MDRADAVGKDSLDLALDRRVNMPGKISSKDAHVPAAHRGLEEPTVDVGDRTTPSVDQSYRGRACFRACAGESTESFLLARLVSEELLPGLVSDGPLGKLAAR
jgi:hypothetical protein